MSRLQDLVDAVAARYADSTVEFVAGKLRGAENGQRRQVIFVRAGGVAAFSSSPQRVTIAAGTRARADFARREQIRAIVTAETEDALDLVFDRLVYSIFDVCGANAFSEENPYEWDRGDSSQAGAFTARMPQITFTFEVRFLARRPVALQVPNATILHGSATVTELGISQTVHAPA